MKPGDLGWLWSHKQGKPVPLLIIKVKSDPVGETYLVLYGSTILDLPSYMIYECEKACSRNFLRAVIF